MLAKSSWLLSVTFLLCLFAHDAVVVRSDPVPELQWQPNPMHGDIVALAHAGLQASNLDKSLEFYTRYLGLKEAFRLLNDDGSTRIIYIYVSGTTFIEFTTRTKARRPERTAMPYAGITHLAIQVSDIKTAVAHVKARGLPAEYILRDEIVHGRDGSLIFNMVDPDGNRIEFMEYPPESRQYQAMYKAAME